MVSRFDYVVTFEDKNIIVMDSSQYIMKIPYEKGKLNAFEHRNNITEEILEKIYLYVKNVFINDKSKKILL